MDDNAFLRLQGAWDNPEQKNECTVRMDDLQRGYWMGTEVGQLGGYGFQEQHLAWTGRVKMRRWGQGAVNSRGQRLTNVHESAEKRKARARPGRSWGGLCQGYSQQFFVKIFCYCAIMRQFCVSSSRLLILPFFL
jgi:hypothetical protein